MVGRCSVCYGSVIYVMVVMVVYCVVGLRIVCYGGVLYVMVVYCMLCTVHYGGVLCGRAV